MSAQRLHKLSNTLTHREAFEIGPFAADYPHIADIEQNKHLEEKDNIHLLENLQISKPTPNRKEKSYRYVDAHMKEVEPQQPTVNIRYGDYVIHQPPGEGWAVAQYLGDRKDTPVGMVRLRKMNALSTRARDLQARNAIWHYEWDAERGPNVVATVGKKHDEKPRAKNTGRLTEAWIDVDPQHILCVVELSRGKIDASSWNNLREILDEDKILSLHLIPFAPRAYA
jgi:hypothetical protein